LTETILDGLDYNEKSVSQQSFIGAFAMPSPFPGMDPYLEGYLWPDVHHALASKIRQLLVPQLSPNYLARLEVSVFEDKNPEGEVGILYPDVEILRGEVPTPTARQYGVGIPIHREQPWK
jgi:hypothetical protein